MAIKRISDNGWNDPLTSGLAAFGVWCNVETITTVEHIKVCFGAITSALATVKRKSNNRFTYITPVKHCETITVV